MSRIRRLTLAPRRTTCRGPQRVEAEVGIDAVVGSALDALAPATRASAQRDWADVLRRAGVRTRCREALGWGTRPL